MSFIIEVVSAAARFRCAAGDTVLQAALRSGVGLPYECNSGGCGTCKFELVEGEMIDAWRDAPGRSGSDLRRGRRLACQSIPGSDCRIKVRLDDACVPQVRPESTELRLSRTREIARDLCELTFTTNRAAQFLPGQFAMLQLGGLRRAYSMSNTAQDDRQWQFIVRRTDGGLMSRALFELKEGARLQLDGPYGLAHLRADSPRDLVCVGGGSGLAPLLSILRGAHLAPRHARQCWLFYGARSASHLPDVAQLLGADLAREVRYRPVLSTEATCLDSGHLKGMVHEHVAAGLEKAAQEYDFYLAGPPPMIEACLRLLVVEHQVPQSQIIYDRFF